MILNRLECEVQPGLLAYLEIRGDMAFWRQNSGVVRPRPGAPPMRFAVPGCSDIICCQAPTGRLVAVESKRTKGGVLSDDQKRFRDWITAHGGFYVVARSIDELRAALGEPTVRIPKPPSGRVYPK